VTRRILPFLFLIKIISRGVIMDHVAGITYLQVKQPVLDLGLLALRFLVFKVPVLDSVALDESED
jgi:hypothetical protein